MQLKTVEIEGKTYAEVTDGKPVYISDGKEVPFDVVATTASITRLNAEAADHRRAKNQAEQALKAYEGIDDPAKARQALETVANLDNKRLIDAGEAERVKTEIAKGFEAKLAEKDGKIGELEKTLHGEMIGGAFARSPLIVGDKAIMAIPADLVQARFGQHFTIENGRVLARDSLGNPIQSKANPTEPASFDEALERIIDAYPGKDTILRGKVAPGGGTGQPGHIPAGKTMSLADFNALDPKTRAAKMAEPGFALTE